MRKLNVTKLSSTTMRTQFENQMTTSLIDFGDTDHGLPNNHWEDLRTQVIQSAADVIGFAVRKHSDWFDENDATVGPMLDRLHTAHIEYANDKNSQAKRECYNQVKQQTQVMLRSMKDQWWVDRTEELQAAADAKDMKSFYTNLKAVYGPHSRGSSPLFDLAGEELIKEPNLITARWAEHFHLLLNRQTTICEEALAEIPQSPVIEVLNALPTIAETTKAIKQMASGKAPGADGIPAEVYKYGGSTLTAELNRLYRVVWEVEHVPQDHKDGLIIHLYKNKGDRRVCDNHRGITLLSIAGKILARIIINRLVDHLDATIPESQCGFRANRGTADMMFSARQIQEKCREQNRDLYMVFVDLTKAFDSVSREGLWKLLSKVGCPDKIVNIIRSFHDGMMVRVQDQGNTSDPFPVTNGAKQGCVMAPFLFVMVFSAMLLDTFKNCDKGVMIRFRKDGGVFNLQRLKARTKVWFMLVRELLFADDCALMAYTQSDAQSIVNDFSRAASRYGLTISIKKTEVLFQPRPGAPPHDSVIMIGDEQLKAVDKFCYLGGVLSQNARIDDEVTARIGKASAAYGRLQHRLWSDHGVRLSTKIAVYRTAVLTTLLYGCETWTWYQLHRKKLEQFHMRCLRKICNISWKDKVPDTEVLERCKITGIEAFLMKAQLRWSGHVVCMDNNRIPKVLFNGELADGHRSQGGQYKRYKDVLKGTLKACNINTADWETRALDRTGWQRTCHGGLERFEGRRIEEKKQRRRARHDAAHDQPPPGDDFVCTDCQRRCRSRIGLFSHRRHNHPHHQN